VTATLDRAATINARP